MVKHSANLKDWMPVAEVIAPGSTGRRECALPTVEDGLGVGLLKLISELENKRPDAGKVGTSEKLRFSGQRGGHEEGR